MGFEKVNPFTKNPLQILEAPKLIIVPSAPEERAPRKSVLTPISSGIATQIAAALSASTSNQALIPTRKVVEERVQYRDAPPTDQPEPPRRRSQGSSAADMEDL